MSNQAVVKKRGVLDLVSLSELKPRQYAIDHGMRGEIVQVTEWPSVFYLNDGIQALPSTIVGRRFEVLPKGTVIEITVGE